MDEYDLTTETINVDWVNFFPLKAVIIFPNARQFKMAACGFFSIGVFYCLWHLQKY